LASTAGGLSITLGSGCTFTISNLSIVQNESGNAGIGLLVTSSSANNGPVNMENVRVGFNETINGYFATNVQLSNISKGNFSDCWFELVGNSTVLFTLDGDSTFPAINDKFVNCFFWNGETGLLTGDRTNSYAQGVSLSNCIFVGPVTCMKWYQGSGSLADSLIITGCQLEELTLKLILIIFYIHR